MLIKVSDNLDKLTVYGEGIEHTSILGFAHEQPGPVEVASFANPVLLTDMAQIARLPSNLRDAVFALYQSYPRSVEYDGVRVSWSPMEYPRVWCPSIDTIFLARGIKKYLGGVESAAEIGCGSGFIIKGILGHAPRLERAVATDINIQAVRCAQNALAGEPDKHKVNFIIPNPEENGLGLSGRFDFIVTNPPYIPRPGAKRDNPYEGLDLVHKLSEQADALLTPEGQILMNLSSLAGNTPLTWFAETGWQVEPLETMRVPLKVNNVTSGVSPESRRWLDYLRDHAVLEIDESEQAGYRYWHTLRLYRITRKK